jgi:hypothetical protein
MVAIKRPRFLAKLLPPVLGGKERWDVKTGTDAAALYVSPIPVPSTIAELIALPMPHDPHARLPAEDVIYAVPCTITLWKIEADSDHHLVMTDDAGHTMIAEIPDPAAIAGPSPWLAQITAARTQFDAWPRLGKPCVVTGVLFYDRIHGQDGVAPNGIELHPVLSIIAP